MTVEDMDWKKISQQSIRNAEHVLISCGLEDMAAVQALQAIGKTVLCTNLYPEAQYSPATVFTEKDVVKCKKILDKAGIGAADQDQVLDTVLDFLTDGQIQRNTFQAAKTDEDDMLFVSKEDKALLHKLICLLQKISPQTIFLHRPICFVVWALYRKRNTTKTRKKKEESKTKWIQEEQREV